MGKGSTRRVEDSEAIRRNWDAVFGPRIRVASSAQPETLVGSPAAYIYIADEPQTEREVTPPALAEHICRIEGCDP